MYTCGYKHTHLQIIHAHTYTPTHTVWAAHADYDASHNIKILLYSVITRGGKLIIQLKIPIEYSNNYLLQKLFICFHLEYSFLALVLYI